MTCTAKTVIAREKKISYSNSTSKITLGIDFLKILT
jgi:hypothetical protein